MTEAGAWLLAIPAMVASIVTGTVDPFALASAEHALGFALGAAITTRLKLKRSTKVEREDWSRGRCASAGRPLA